MGTVLIDRPTPEITLLTLNRPGSLNSLSLELVHDLGDELDRINMDGDCRAVILTGSGRGFCAGNDLSSMEQDGTVQGALAYQELLARIVLRIRSLRQPVIAAVNGPAAGGGFALALACDTRICSESARFNSAFVRIGLSGCDLGLSYLLPRSVSRTLAFEMMLTGRLIDANEAHRSGLVLDVVPDEGVIEAAVAIAKRICGNSPLGVTLTKQLMWANLEASGIESAMRLENHTQVMASFTEDCKEAIESFVSRRSPVFKNR